MVISKFKTIIKGALSFKAVDQNDRILGICLNSISEMGDLEIMRALSRNSDNPQIAFLFHIWSLIQEESNLHERFKCDKIFEVVIRHLLFKQFTFNKCVFR